MELQKLAESLSPNERKILPYLEEKISDICKKTNLDKISVLRALEYLQNKDLVKLTTEKKKIIDLGVNGTYYLRKGLPERRLLTLLTEKRILSFEEAEKGSGLSENEFKAALGALKKKALADIKNGKVIINASNEEIAKKSLEELFIASLPLELDKLAPEQMFALKALESRKEIVEIKEESEVFIKVTDLGKKLANSNGIKEEMIEAITPELLLKESNWKSKKFRRYDVTSAVPEISGGKRHFVNQSLDYVRKIWTDMGFQEMTGDMLLSSFWVFDALFTAQDHPVRDTQDTFFINKKLELPDKKLVALVKKTHEEGIGGSKGWQYSWNEEEARRAVLRTHTTCLSAQTLTKTKEVPAKFFALGKNFRNETVDWSHGFEFYQTEGIVIDPNANFRNLLGYLAQFYKKMGFEKVRFRPSYFPYTEPSVEIDAWHSEKKIWLEMGGAGIFRPEITIPLFGKHIPVLAWGQGVDRIIMDFYKIKDLREMYKNDISQLRKMKFWSKI